MVICKKVVSKGWCKESKFGINQGNEIKCKQTQSTTTGPEAIYIFFSFFHAQLI